MEDMMNLFKAVGYEMELNKMDSDIGILLNIIEIFSNFVDVKYEDKLRDIELITEVKSKIEALRILILKINEIEQKTISINDNELIFKCESRKAKIINMMKYLNNKYMM